MIHNIIVWFEQLFCSHKYSWEGLEGNISYRCTKCSKELKV